MSVSLGGCCCAVLMKVHHIQVLINNNKHQAWMNRERNIYCPLSAWPATAREKLLQKVSISLVSFPLTVSHVFSPHELGG